ncbi:hypothetical protein ADJ73_04995 [Arsenicicoccus sp. oral taxon 190]|nr:hypothetical protein ADJ73_04995 [Arsenicicoccus sp. oral taxon 190]
MTWLAALVLGMVQGLTEFLPISSTAHLRVVAAPAGWPNPGAAFTVVTQRGTESAVLLYFRRDTASILRTWTRSRGPRACGRTPKARPGWPSPLAGAARSPGDADCRGPRDHPDDDPGYR